VSDRTGGALVSLLLQYSCGTAEISGLDNDRASAAAWQTL